MANEFKRTEDNLVGEARMKNRLAKGLLGWVLFVGAGAWTVGYWRGPIASSVLLLWVPILFGVAYILSGKRELVDQLRSSALWFAISTPKSHEHGFGYGRTFEWNPDLVREFAKAKFSGADPYNFPIGSGRSWFSGDQVGQELDFSLGVRENVLQLSPQQAQYLSHLCLKCVEASERCGNIFVLAWISAIVMAFCADISTSLILLGGCSSIVVWKGVLSATSLGDRTEEYGFICREHFHVYAYQPKGFYWCSCGKIEKESTES